ncbi:TetR/AcrR family transcriptional regulator [bacterium]|nr:MAG: TetR/AcrR family transcriptional regulator [bacterium]
MARRGDQLREHILWKAKDVFLQMGFERASMDVVAARAETSKRTLYAHFESKENLFLAVIELVRGLFLNRLKSPSDYGEDPSEALVLFCGRYLGSLRYQPSIQMCRLSMAETARFPQGAAQHFDAMFTEVGARIGTYLDATYGLPSGTGDAAAQRLLAELLYPRLLRALFGLDELANSFEEAALSESDLVPVREAVTEMLRSLPQPP